MATKYVSFATGVDSPGSGAFGSPYKTAQYAAGQNGAGDEILLNAGETNHQADIYVDTPKTGMVFGAYGSGAIPVISGFVTATGWVSEGGNIYSFTDAGLPSILNVVTVNGSFRPRIINPTYRTFTAHTGTGVGTITDSSLPNSPSFAGAEIVIRKTHWVLDRAVVVSHSAGVITYTGLSGHSDSGNYTPLDGYGYYFQNHPNCLTSEGDWYYDGTAKKLYMYFPSNNPNSFVVKCSKVFRGFNFGATGCRVENIEISGVNQFGIIGGQALTVLNGKFSFNGTHGMYLNGATNLSISNTNFIDLPNNAITGDGSGNNDWTLTGNIFNRIHHHGGAGGSRDTQGIAIAVFGSGFDCQYNQILNCGYEAIYARGNGFQVDNNLIDTFGYIKDDGGGVYTFEGTTTTNSLRRSIKNNIILNGIGAGLGTADGENKAFGLYPDERASQIDIEGNLVAYCNKGYFGHNAYDVNIRNKNIFYDNDTAIHIRSFDAANPSTDIDLDGNVILAKTGQKLIVHDSAAASNTSWGTSNNNKFYSNDANPFQTRLSEGSFVDQSFAGWKTATSKDGASALTAFTGDIIRYNATATPAGVSIPGTYIDSQGVSHAGTITLGDHESELLFFNAVSGRILKKDGKILTIGGKILVTA